MLVSASLFGGCVDNAYDLANIDTNVEARVSNLTLPINIDPISLESIIDLKEGEDIQIVDGNYAIVKQGDFFTDPILIPAINLKAPQVASSLIPVSLMNFQIPQSSRATMPTSFSYDIATTGNDLTFEASFVSEFIVSIDHLGCKLSLGIDISMDGLEDYVRKVSFSNIVLQLPKGLDLIEPQGGSYNKQTGELSLADCTVEGTSMSIRLDATGVDFNLIGGIYNYSTQHINVTSSLYIKQGRATVALEDIIGSIYSLPQTITLHTDYLLSDTQITTFTGDVKYTLNESELSTVDLSSLPDLLSQQGTDLLFVNPQIYLNVANPLSSYKLYAQTGINITANRPDQSTTYSLDNSIFRIGGNTQQADNRYCLSPMPPKSPWTGFADAEHVAFTSLSRVVSGDGLPESLSISLTDASVPQQHVEQLKLGQELGAVSGQYVFVAPLQLSAGSTIVYRHTIDGWSSEDLDKLTITELLVHLDITTDIPAEVEFTGYPIDAEGNQINDIEIIGATVPAMANEHHLVITCKGEIKHLDGIKFVARASASSAQTVLNPQMTVTLTNIRPTVWGYYNYEL